MPFPDGTPSNPLQFIQSFRQHFVNLHLLWTRGGVPAGVTHTTPSETPIRDADLPSELGPLLADFRQNHPNAAQIAWERHMNLVDGKVVNVIEDERDLPPDEAIISVSRTLSLNTADTARTIVDLFVGRIGASS